MFSSSFLKVEAYDVFNEWPEGNCRYVYNAEIEDARRHVSGWAMRNTNNHNAHILKKSCLGVYVCSHGCRLDNGAKKRTLINITNSILQVNQCDEERERHDFCDFVSAVVKGFVFNRIQMLKKGGET
jgi:hypothetical protein